MEQKLARLTLWCVQEAEEDGLRVVVSTMAWAGLDALVLSCSLYSNDDDDLEVEVISSVLSLLSFGHASCICPLESQWHLHRTRYSGCHTVASMTAELRWEFLSTKSGWYGCV